jgi:branched-chain amino acid transport system ATP-binding protein
VDILECQGVTKAYGGLLAVQDVSFAVHSGEVFAIVGPNGAGKTTLFDTISGVTRATQGAVRFEGGEIQRLRPHEISRLGLVRTFQTTVAFDSQTVLANTLVGALFGRRNGERIGLVFPSRAIDAALEALVVCGLADKQSASARTLSNLDRKRLMLATALATKPKLLLLDEPAGGLNPAERTEMIELIRTVNESGITVVLIEHVMKAVQALASRMLVLHHGRTITEGRPADVLRDQRVVEVYLGMASAGGT